MGFLKSLLLIKPRANRSRIAVRTAAVIDHVIYDVGIDALVNGSLSLDRKFRPRFTCRRPVLGSEIIATVAIGELDEGARLRSLNTWTSLDASALGVHTGSLVYAVMREFTSQSPAFRSLR
jgi:hypothetical protein